MIHRGNGRAIHGDMLRLSDPNWFSLENSLAERMHEQFLDVCELFGRNAGGAAFPVPKEMEVHFLRWRAVLLRHRRGDYRNSPSEWESIKEVAQFLFDWHNRLRGQPERTLEWIK